MRAIVSQFGERTHVALLGVQNKRSKPCTTAEIFNMSGESEDFAAVPTMASDLSRRAFSSWYYHLKRNDPVSIQGQKT